MKADKLKKKVEQKVQKKSSNENFKKNDPKATLKMLVKKRRAPRSPKGLPRCLLGASSCTF